MEFQRARSEEQREQRRTAILETTAAMLAEMSVSSVSLNELSRRVGLAKSNVLRYFESREAILLDLLDAEISDWVVAVDRLLDATVEGEPHERADTVAARVTASLAERPVMCDLISAQAAVLERNISMDVALRHKYATGASVMVLIEAIVRVLPELDAQAAYEVVAITFLMTSAAWPHSQPSEALLAAYAADPAVAAGQTDFSEFVRRTLELTISGLLVRRAMS
ncbi:TetR family transcriptional regulator [Promicromonospora sukumoe]|uniref:TetR/AcrR family transcriptional regulator n=1 Tax=Promicromonospora sukumoe TaxID=88382 RepID=UPI00365B1D4F